jgi:hypothetical protein
MWRGLGLWAACVGLVACHADVVRPFEHPAGGGGTSASDRAAVVLQESLHISLLDPAELAAGHRQTHYLRAAITGSAGLALGRGEVAIPGGGALISVRARSWPAGDPHQVSELAPYAVAFQEAQPFAGMLYSATQVALFDVPGVQVGDVMEYETVVEVPGPAAIPAWTFGEGHYTELSELSVDVPAGQGLHVVTLKAGEATALSPTRSPIPGGERWTWRRVQVPAAVASPDEDPRLTTWVSWRSAFPDWAAVGRWYRALSQGLDVLLPSQVPLLSTPTGDPRRDWYDFVRDRVRYLAYYQEAIDGYRPHSAEVVLQGRFGDCKDMSTLLLALYRAAGVEAYPALTRIGGSTAFPTDVPTAAAFNHVVVALPRGDGGYLLVDPTDKLGVFGETGAHLVGRHALVVRPQDAELMVVPPPPPAQNRAEVAWTLRPDGGARLVARLSGSEARWVREALRTWGEAALQGAAEAHLLTRWPGAELRQVELTTEQAIVRLEADVVVVGAAQAPGGGWSAGALTVLPLARFFDQRPADPSVPGERETTLTLTVPAEREVTLPTPAHGDDEALGIERRGPELVLHHRVQWRTREAAQAVPRAARDALVLGAAVAP